MTKTLQNATFSAKDQADIEIIKQMILDRKTELEMSETLGLHRTTISRKISRWAKTPDFRNWIKEAWTRKLSRVNDDLAFRGLTLIMRLIIKYEMETQPSEAQAPSVFRWMTQQEWKQKLLSDTSPSRAKTLS